MKTLAFAISSLLASAVPSLSATFAVNSTADLVDANPGDGVCETAPGNGVCTLRAAIQEAGALSGPSTINIPAGMYQLSATPACTYSLVSNHNVLVENLSALCVKGNVTITGAGSDSTIIDAGGAAGASCCGGYPSARGMVIPLGAQVSISGITIQNGRSNGGFTWFGGGAIDNEGYLAISDSVLTTNIGLPGGGAIWNDGTLVMNNVTLNGNTATAYGGGAIYNNTSGVAEISNSTFTDNASQANGGAIFNIGNLKLLSSALVNNTAAGGGGGVYTDSGPLSLTNVTIAQNQGSSGAAIWNHQAGTVTANNATIALNHATNVDGGIFNNNGNNNSVIVLNSIIAGNYDDSNPSVFTDCAGPITSQGHNLISTVPAICHVTGATGSDIYGQDARLAPLVSGGGSTPTLALLSTSPAIDAGDPSAPGSGNTACAAADQRGILRPQGSRCDIGAFERSAALSITGISPRHAGNTGSVEGVISGSGILDGATVVLRRSGQTDIPGTLVTAQPGNLSMAAIFDLTGRAPGNWDVVVNNTDGSTATLPGGFGIDSGGAAQVWVEAVGPVLARPSTSPTFYIMFGNRGNSDALDVPVTLSVPANVLVKLLFFVDPPPSQAGQIATDWNLAPLYVSPAATSGFVNVPLLIPVIPAGYTGALRFSLTVPGTLQEGDSFVFYATAGDALLQPGGDARTVAGELAAHAVDYAQAYLGVTIQPSQVAQVQQYTANQLQNAVNNGRAAFSTSSGAAIPIYSLAQMNIDAALFAAAHAAGQMSSNATTAKPAARNNLTVRPQDSGGGQSNILVCWVDGRVVYIHKGDVQPEGSSCNDPEISIPPPPCEAIQKPTAEHPCLPPEPAKPFTPADCRDLPGHHVNASGSLCVPNKGNHCAIFTNPLSASPDCAIIPIKTSVDPNAKFGPPGPATQQFHTSGTSFNYNIEFENQPTASLPAQQVVVTDHLDSANLDLATFSLGPITLGSHNVTPPAGAQHLGGGLDLRPDQNTIVKIDADLNVSTGIVTWRFTTLDPDTEQLTTDPTSGFLPPDIAPPQGEGALLYSINPKPGLPTGTTICNQATVVFDANAPINTQNWCNTIDDILPTSRLNPLPLTQTSASFPVQWAGSDTGSGIHDYTIYVADNGSPYTRWLSDTTLTQSTYPGLAGHSYAFYSIALDAAYNLESPKIRPDAVTLVSNGPVCAPGSCFLVSATPSGGYASIGVPYTYQFAYTDANGSSMLQQVSMTIGSSTGLANSCKVAWYRSDHTIRLYDDTGTGSYTQGPDSGGSLGNSQCSVSFSHPIVESGNNLTMTLSITFKQSFTGNKYIYMQALDNASTDTGLQLMSTVNIATSTPCDANASGSTEVVDVQKVVNEALGLTSGIHDLNGDHLVGVADIQIVINAALGMVCGAM